MRGGLTEKVEQDHVVRLHFTDVGKLPPPVLQFANVTFGYSKDHVLYRDVRAAVSASYRLSQGPRGISCWCSVKSCTGAHCCCMIQGGLRPKWIAGAALPYVAAAHTCLRSGCQATCLHNFSHDPYDSGALCHPASALQLTVPLAC